MVISGFEWDDRNVVHIERHQFTPDEVGEVFAGDYKTGDRLYIAPGETLGRPSGVCCLSAVASRTRPGLVPQASR